MVQSDRAGSGQANDLVHWQPPARDLRLTGEPKFADYPFRPALAWIGAAVFVSSLWLFHRTHKDLGRNWSVTLEICDRHSLVTSGVYRHVRHPMYSAFWLWAIAQSPLLPNWIAGPARASGHCSFSDRARGAVDDRSVRRRVSRYMRRTSRVPRNLLSIPGFTPYRPLADDKWRSWNDGRRPKLAFAAARIFTDHPVCGAHKRRSISQPNTASVWFGSDRLPIGNHRWLRAMEAAVSESC